MVGKCLFFTLCLLFVIELAANEPANELLPLGESSIYAAEGVSSWQLLELKYSYVRDDLELAWPSSIASSAGDNKKNSSQVLLTPLLVGTVPFSFGKIEDEVGAVCDRGIAYNVVDTFSPQQFPSRLLLPGEVIRLSPSFERLIEAIEESPRYNLLKQQFQYRAFVRFIFSEYVLIPFSLLLFLGYYLFQRLVRVHSRNKLLGEYQELVDRWRHIPPTTVSLTQKCLEDFLVTMRTTFSIAFGEAGSTLALSEIYDRLQYVMAADERRRLRSAFEILEERIYGTSVQEGRNENLGALQEALTLVHQAVLLCLLQNQLALKGLLEEAEG